MFNIDAGRKGFATRGKAEEGRISYETGIAEAMSAFKEAQATADPQIIIIAEYTFLNHKDYRVSGYPKDSFHIACGSHITRIKNMLRTPGVDPIEKSLLKQRLSNLPTAQNGYIEKQKKALAN
jgi:hypothetical protein